VSIRSIANAENAATAMGLGMWKGFWGGVVRKIGNFKFNLIQKNNIIMILVTLFVCLSQIDKNIMYIMLTSKVLIRNLRG
jgi:hypothetical protein